MSVTYISIAALASSWATALHERADVRRVGTSCIMHDSSMRCVVMSSHGCNQTFLRARGYPQRDRLGKSARKVASNTLHGGFALHNVCVGPGVSQEGPIGQLCPMPSLGGLVPIQHMIVTSTCIRDDCTLLPRPSAQCRHALRRCCTAQRGSLLTVGIPCVGVVRHTQGVCSQADSSDTAGF